MGKFVPALMLGMLATIAELSAQTRHQYWYVSESSDHTQVEFIDAASIAPINGTVRRAWAFTYRSPQSKSLPGIQSATLEEYNCRTRQLRSLEVTANDGSGAYVPSASENGPEAWDYAVPGSIGEARINFVCAKSATERKVLAIGKMPRDSTDGWAKSLFETEAYLAAWAKLTPAQQLNQMEPDWRKLAASKEFADWLANAPQWDRDATRRNGNQVVDPEEAAMVLEHFKQAQQPPAVAVSAGRH